MFLEGHVELESYSPFVYIGIACIGESSDIFYAEHAEDVVYADDGFPVGLPVHGGCSCGQLEEHGVVGSRSRVVFVGEMSAHSFDGDELAELEVVEEGDAVEQLSVHVPCDAPEGVSVVEELHVVHEGEGLVVVEVGEVDGWHDEQWVGHFVPLCSCLGEDVNSSPASEPLPFVEACFGEVEVVVSSDQVLYSGGVPQVEVGFVVVDGDSVLLGVYECGVGAVSDSEGDLGGSYFLDFGCSIDGYEVEFGGYLVLLGFDSEASPESPSCFVLEVEFLPVVEVHFSDVFGSEGHEGVVFVVVYEFV